MHVSVVLYEVDDGHDYSDNDNAVSHGVLSLGRFRWKRVFVCADLFSLDYLFNLMKCNEHI